MSDRHRCPTLCKEACEQFKTTYDLLHDMARRQRDLVQQVDLLKEILQEEFDLRRPNAKVS